MNRPLQLGQRMADALRRRRWLTFAPLLLFAAFSAAVVVGKSFRQERERERPDMAADTDCSLVCEAMLRCGQSKIGQNEAPLRAACFTGCRKHPSIGRACRAAAQDVSAESRRECRALNDCLAGAARR